MVSSVIKRNGKIVDFDKSRIEEAIFKANKDVQGRQKASIQLTKEIAKSIQDYDKVKLNVEEIQDMVEKKLMEALALYQTMYLNKELPVETYRNLDTGMFEYGGQFEMDTIDEDYIEDVDVSYNYMTYVLPMIQILLKKGD